MTKREDSSLGAPILKAAEQESLAGPPQRPGLPEPVPFYEKIIKSIGIPYGLSCFFLGLIVFVFHGAAGLLNQVNIFRDRSFFLGPMIAIILYLVIWSTIRLKLFAASLPAAFGIATSDQLKYIFIARTLSNRIMTKYGITFGVLNCLFGIVYGIWYREILLVISLLVQFFLVGFICGLAICGIVGIIRMVAWLSREEDIRLNIFHPDSCGGTAYIGDLLLAFSLVSLFAGILIGYYIYSSPWTNGSISYVKFSLYAWMGFPHFAAVGVLLLPLCKLHGIINKYKKSQLGPIESEIKEYQHKIMTTIGQVSSGPVEILLLQSLQNQQLHELYRQLSTMKTVPISRRTGLGYVSSFFVSFLIPLTELMPTLADVLRK